MLTKFLVGEHENKRPIRRPSRIWEDNVRMDLRNINWEYVDWIHIAQDRDKLWAVVNTVMEFRVR
jgi:hypothetical protein